MSPNNQLPEDIQIEEFVNPLEEKVVAPENKGPGLRALRNQYKKNLRRTGPKRTYTKAPAIQTSTSRQRQEIERAEVKREKLALANTLK
jgi:hypothetical protein